MNLSAYFSNLLFLENIKDDNPYDYILLDPSIDVPEGVLESTKKTMYVHLQKQPLQQILGEIYHYLDKAKNPLLILDTLSVQQLQPVFAHIDCLTIINANTGLSSFGTKLLPEIRDIEYMIYHGFDVYEPFDFVSSIQLLKKSTNKSYIRLAGFPIEGKLFDNEKLSVDANELGIEEDLEIAIVDKTQVAQQKKEHASEYMSDKQQLLSFTNHGFTGQQATILVAGSYLPSTFQAAALLHQQDIFFDLFGIVDYNFSLNKEFQKSLHATEHLIVILDQQASLLYQGLIKAKLFDVGLYETEIDFVYPQYGDLKTIVDEYMPDQVGFDQIGLARKIGQLLN